MTVGFVNSGAVGSQTSGTSITAPQPASVVSGNLLIACFTCSIDETQTLSAGWTRIGADETPYQPGGWRCGVAYRVATGSDELIISSATSSYRSARIYQYSGTNSIGATSSNNSQYTTTHSTTSITSTGDNSMVALIDLSNSGSPNLTTPAGWTSDSSGSWSNGTFDACSKTLGAAGSTSGATSSTGASLWLQKQVELLSIPPEEGSSTSTLGSITASSSAVTGTSGPIAIVNVGQSAATLSGTSVELELPPNLVNGNILLAFLMFRGTAGTITWPAGWTEVDTNLSYGSIISTSVAVKEVLGTETNPVVSHPDGSSNGGIFQFSGVDVSSPIGNVNFNTDDLNPEHVDGWLSSADESWSIYFWAASSSFGNSGHIPNPSGWTIRFASDDANNWEQYNRISVGCKALGVSGSATGDIDETSGRTKWSLWNIELLGAPYDIPADGESDSIFGNIDGTATAESGNASVATLGSISGQASAVSQDDLTASNSVTVSGSAVGQVSRFVSVDSSFVALTSAASPLVFIVTADSAVLAVHAASAYRDLSVVADSIAALSSSAPVVAVYSVSVDSLVSVLAGLQFVADFTDGWAYNLNTGAGSFYEGFSFNSFAMIDGEHYGANETGIFRLGSDADDSLPINMTVTLGTSNLGSPKVKRVPAAYVGAQSDLPLVLTCRVEGKEYSYTFSRATATVAPAKVQVGKGLAGVYWQIELTNTDGADAEIDALELLVSDSAQRRV